MPLTCETILSMVRSAASTRRVGACTVAMTWPGETRSPSVEWRVMLGAGASASAEPAVSTPHWAKCWAVAPRTSSIRPKPAMVPASRAVNSAVQRASPGTVASEV